jgi:hypothetical protein
VDDDVIGVDELSRHLVGQVLALVADLPMSSGHSLDGTFSMSRSFALRCQMALGGFEAGPGPLPVATV